MNRVIVGNVEYSTKRRFHELEYESKMRLVETHAGASILRGSPASRRNVKKGKKGKELRSYRHIPAS